jgi:hypothetical protein
MDEDVGKSDQGDETAIPAPLPEGEEKGVEETGLLTGAPSNAANAAWL